MSHLEPTNDERAREDKLPGWARDLITSLRSAAGRTEHAAFRAREEIDELRARIAADAEANTGPEDSTAWLWRENDGEELPSLGLGADAFVDFRPTSGIEITVTAHGNGINVTSQLHLMVIPISRCEFRIQPVSAKIKD